LARFSERDWCARIAVRARAAVALCAMVAGAGQVSAQSLGGHITFDSLQISALSADVGAIRPSQADQTTIYGIAADYGKLSRTLRLRFEGSYWQSRLTDAVTRAFVDSLNHLASIPGAGGVKSTRVNVYDVTVGGSVRWVPMQSAVIQPFGGVGIAMHVINAEGPLIDGTFVENLFDSFSTGLFAEAGAAFKPVKEFGIEARARADLVNFFRSVSLRAGGVYYFGPLRRIDQ
jgi:hypothetical protein